MQSNHRVRLGLFEWEADDPFSASSSQDGLCKLICHDSRAGHCGIAILLVPSNIAYEVKGRFCVMFPVKQALSKISAQPATLGWPWMVWFLFTYLKPALFNIQSSV